MTSLMLRGLGAIVVLMGITLAPPSLAATSISALQSLNATRVLLDKANMDYQMFKSENSNPRYGDMLEDDLDELAEHQDAFRDALAEAGHGEEVKAIDKHIDRYVKLLRGNFRAIAGGGYEAPALVDEMMSNKLEAQRLISTLYATLAEGSEMDPRAREYQELSYIMQRMAAHYVENAASFAGIAFRDQSDERTIDQLAQEFSSRLGKLDDKGLPAGTQSLINDVRRKWSFIEQSMMNYMQNQVAFLVYRYSNTIVDNLLSASRQLLGDDEAEVVPAGEIPLPPGIPAAQ